jgi:hypothetical protein
MTICIIAGGRDYHPTAEGAAWLGQLLVTLGIVGVVSGGASGADNFGEWWAQNRGIPVKIFKADWQTHGSAAGPMRNEQMAKFLKLYLQSAVLLFPGGRGTQSMRNIAKREGIPVYEFPHLTPSL